MSKWLLSSTFVAPEPPREHNETIDIKTDDSSVVFPENPYPKKQTNPQTRTVDDRPSDNAEHAFGERNIDYPALNTVNTCAEELRG